MDLLENPLHVILLGALFICLFGAVWWHSQHRGAFMATLAALLLTIGGVLAERWIETPRESVIRTLEEIAAQIGNVPPVALLEHIHSSAEEIRERARWQLERYDVSQGKITQVWEVNVDDEGSPPRAVAKFNASIVGGTKSGDIRDRRGVLYFIVTLEQENGVWKVLDYEYHDPHTPMLKTHPGIE